MHTQPWYTVFMGFHLPNPTFQAEVAAPTCPYQTPTQQKQPRGPIFRSVSGLRFYSPEMGRWLKRDPYAEEGGASLYGFCLNSALYLVDPDGRSIFRPGDLPGDFPIWKVPKIPNPWRRNPRPTPTPPEPYFLGLLGIQEVGNVPTIRLPQTVVSRAAGKESWFRTTCPDGCPTS